MAFPVSLDRPALRAAQWEKLRAILQRMQVHGGSAAERVAGVESLESFCRVVNPLSKADILADRQLHPPFGSYLLEPLEHYTRLCQTSGTSTGQPIAWIDTPKSWEAMLKCWRRVYEAAELQPGKDRLFFAFSFGPFLGFWTAFEAATTEFLSIPGGGLSSSARLRAMARYQATVLCCTPTYAMRLGEQIGEASGVQRQELAVHSVIVAGEAGGSLPAVRGRIEALWGARVFDHHGMTEVGPVSFESRAHPLKLLVMEEAYLAEVVDPHTGREVAEGECGELLLTTLDRAACPLLRYRTGDWVRKTFLEGRLCLDGGVLSRVDDMVVVRGVNVYPSAIEEVVRRYPEVVEFQVRQTAVAEMEELRVRAEIQPDLKEVETEALLRRLEGELRDTFALRIPVDKADPGSLPRHEFKAKRWVRAE